MSSSSDSHPLQRLLETVQITAGFWAEAPRTNNDSATTPGDTAAADSGTTSPTDTETEQPPEQVLPTQDADLMSLHLDVMPDDEKISDLREDDQHLLPEAAQQLKIDTKLARQSPSEKTSHKRTSSLTDTETPRPLDQLQPKKDAEIQRASLDVDDAPLEETVKELKEDETQIMREVAQQLENDFCFVRQATNEEPRTNDTSSPSETESLQLLGQVQPKQDADHRSARVDAERLGEIDDEHRDEELRIMRNIIQQLQIDITSVRKTQENIQQEIMTQGEQYFTVVQNVKELSNCLEKNQHLHKEKHTAIDADLGTLQEELSVLRMVVATQSTPKQDDALSARHEKTPLCSPRLTQQVTARRNDILETIPARNSAAASHRVDEIVNNFGLWIHSHLDKDARESYLDTPWIAKLLIAYQGVPSAGANRPDAVITTRIKEVKRYIVYDYRHITYDRVHRWNQAWREASKLVPARMQHSSSW